ncbi:MAG: hypothetical protein ACP5HG_11500 [Anaerolineae bacterium]
MADLLRYGRWMRTFPYSRPVDRVDFIGPDGDRETRPTFLHQPAELSYDDHGYEHLTVTGEPVYAVRFTPIKVGMYRYRAFAGEKVMEEGGFRCAPGEHAGLVMPNPKEPRYLITTNGDAYCPIGLCMAGPPRYPLPQGTGHFETGEARATLGAAEYERWFRLLSENGGNFARIWLSHPYFNVESAVAGELDLAAFARLDAVVEHARTYGIRLKLCFEHFRTFEPGSPFSKELHHPEDGRRPESVNAWLTDATWRELWLKKVRAYTARYDGDPVVMAWELWNEMDCVDADFDLVVEWTADMTKALKELSPHHPVTNSLGSFDDEGKIETYKSFYVFALDIRQVHRYLDQGAPWEICREDPVALTVDAVSRVRHPSRPTLLAETGAVNDRHTGPFRYYRMDDRGILFHDTTFPAFFAGAAGPGHIWHWDEYVDQKNLWHHYRPFSQLLQGVNPALEAFVPMDLSNDNAWFLALKGRGHVLAWVRNKADSWHAVLRDGLTPPLLESQTFDLGELPWPESEVALYWPWAEEPDEPAAGEGSVVDGVLRLPPFRYGLFVRIGRRRRRPKRS